MPKPSLAKNTLLISTGMIIQKILTFLMLPFFAKWVSVEDFGVYDLCMTYASLCIPILSLGVNDSVFRNCVDTESVAAKKPFVSNAAIINIAGIFLLAVAGAFLYSRINPKLLLPFLLLAVSEMATIHLRGFLRGIKKLDIFGFSALVSATSMAVLTTFFIRKLNMGADGLLFGYAGGCLTGAVFTVSVTKYWRYLSFKTFDFKIMRLMLTFSLPLILNNVSWWVVNTSDRTVISIFLGSVQNGIYAIANKIPAVCIAVYGMFHIAWNQAAVEMIGSEENNRYFNETFNKIFRILISLIGGLLSLNFIIFGWIFDTRYALAAFHAPILLIAVIFHALGHFIGGIQIAQKNSLINGLTTFFGAAVNIVIHLVLIEFIGLYAASVSTFLSEIVIFLTKNRFLKKSVSCQINLRLHKNSWRLTIYLIYLFIVQYIKLPMAINILNIILASVMLIVINKDIILKMTEKVKQTTIRKFRR